MEKIKQERITELFEAWRRRSKLNINQILMRMQLEIDEDFTRPMLENRFIRPEPGPDLTPAQILAVIAAFTDNLPAAARCTAAEAVELADLARLPVSRFEELRRFFPPEEFNQAIGQYLPQLTTAKILGQPPAIVLSLHPEVNVERRPDKRLTPARPLMPLYENDVLHTYSNASATFFCHDTGVLHRVPERQVKSINCAQATDPDAFYLDQLLNRDEAGFQAGVTKFIADADAVAYLLVYYFEQRGDHPQALARLTHLTRRANSAWLWLRLGDERLRQGDYPQAAAAYQTALTMAQGDEDLAAARLGLAITAYARHNPAEAITRLQGVDRGPDANTATALRSMIEQTLPKAERLTLNQYVRLLAGQIAPHLQNGLRAIPDSFLERLEAQRANLSLKSQTAAWVGLGSGLEAMETLTAVYLTTHALLETLPPAELAALSADEPWLKAIEQQAGHIAHTMVGLPPQQADDFARQYALTVAQSLPQLQELSL